ncbi:MAG: MarR family transcriptional regulator [Acidothermus sp.]|nr:MarR family transcriptional regulator [Acidothermus sp.]
MTPEDHNRDEPERTERAAVDRAGLHHADVVRRVAALVDASGTLRRVLRARMRAAWPYDDLPTGQLDLLRLLVENPGLSVGEAAEKLAIAPNSVSTMVRAMVRAQLLERRPDPKDGRAVRLFASSAAARRLQEWRARRADVLASALEGWDDATRDSLVAAIEAIEKLTRALGPQ